MPSPPVLCPCLHVFFLSFFLFLKEIVLVICCCIKIVPKLSILKQQIFIIFTESGRQEYLRGPVLALRMSLRLQLPACISKFIHGAVFWRPQCHLGSSWQDASVLGHTGLPTGLLTMRQLVSPRPSDTRERE